LNKSIETRYSELVSKNKSRYDDDSDGDNDDDCNDDGDGDEEACKINHHDKNSCINCYYKLILHYNLFNGVCFRLLLCYKLKLTLSITQVSCERSFSKLKALTIYLRSNLTQDHLESFMLIAMEKDNLISSDPEDIIDVIATKSLKFQKILCF